MTNKTFIVVLFLFGFLFNCNTPVEVSKHKTLPEADDPDASAVGQWDAVENGFHASFGSIDKRYSRSTVPNIEKSNSWLGTAWKGERLNAQLVLWTSNPIEKVECKASDLKNESGEKIDASNIRTSFVRYVLTDEFSGGCGYKNHDSIPAHLVADGFDESTSFDIPENSVRPVWITIDVPAKTAPGEYEGSISIEAKNQKPQNFHIKVMVQSYTLPAPSDWTFHLDLWQNPYAVARYHKVDLWSKEHFDLMKPLYTMLAEAGQKCITTSIMFKPWGGQTLDHFESMIDWTKKENGKWAFDYSVFDKWVEFAMACGITKQINCYSMVPWGNQFTYFDEKSGKDKTVKAKPGTPAYLKLWKPFLKSFERHLNEKGWQDITTIAMDERKLEDMQKMLTLVKEQAPSLKIALAGNYHKEIDADIYDFCIASGDHIPADKIKERLARSHPTTFYVCCTEAYPNNFTFSPPAESTWLGWYAASKGFSGFLRWAYNSWVEDPVKDSRFRTWPAGDTYFVYPGALSSIRFERLREGIQDYEKIRILRKELKENDHPSAKIKRQKLDDLLKGFSIDRIPGEPCAAMVKRGKGLIDELSME